MQSPESLGSDGAPGLSPAPPRCTVLPCLAVTMSFFLPLPPPSSHLLSLSSPSSSQKPPTPSPIVPKHFILLLHHLASFFFLTMVWGQPFLCLSRVTAHLSPHLLFLTPALFFILKVYDIWGTGKEIFLTNKRTYIRKKLKYMIPVSCSKHT